MARFQYIALDAKGEQSANVIEANSEAEAVQQLRANGLYPTHIQEEGKGAKPKATASGHRKQKTATKSKALKGQFGLKVKPKNLMIFTRQLATLIDSGLPLVRSLTVLEKQEPNPLLKHTVNQLADNVQGGSTFSESLAQHPNIFNKLYVNMVKAGELGGVLELVLTRLAEYQEKAQKLKNKIVSAMVYPVIVMLIAVGILTFLMIFIVPKFKEMFTENDQQLPLISRIVFGASEFCLKQSVGPLPNILFVFLGIFVAYFLLTLWGKTKAGRRFVDTMKIRMPVIGDLQRKSSVARFSRTLGTLVTSGVPILQALNITRDTAGNVVISDAIDKVHEAVKEGESIVAPLQASGVFPNMVISMVDVGEETGQLPEMLLKVADVYDDEVDTSVAALTSILEPIMIVILALVVGSVVFALFLPLIKMVSRMSE